jgi:hypothetical protein
VINLAVRSPPGSGTPEKLRRAEGPAAIVQAAQYARGENAERAGSSKPESAEQLDGVSAS